MSVNKYEFVYYLKDKNAGMQKTSAYQEQSVLRLLNWCSIPLVTIQVFVQPVKEMPSLFHYPVWVFQLSSNQRFSLIFAETEQVSFCPRSFQYGEQWSSVPRQVFCTWGNCCDVVHLQPFSRLKFCFFSSFSGVTLYFCCSLWDSRKSNVLCWAVTSLLTASRAV